MVGNPTTAHEWLEKGGGVSTSDAKPDTDAFLIMNTGNNYEALNPNPIVSTGLGSGLGGERWPSIAGLASNNAMSSALATLMHKDG